MCQRIRAAMDNQEFRELMGEVEIDETYIGGEKGNRPKSQRSKMPKKVGVVGAIARKGSVVAKVIGSAGAPTISRFVRRTVSPHVSLVATDKYPAYDSLKAKGYPHESVDHSAGEYVRGNVHTAHLDSFWSLLKRGIMGSFHQVSKKYLPLYVAEFTFRHNYRDDADMFGRLIARC
jgi:IS1 family transposase